MPECPEVRIFTDQLATKFASHHLNNVEIMPNSRFWKEGINTYSVDKVMDFPLTNAQFNCKGKFMYWSLEEDRDGKKKPIFFFISLGMEGSFRSDQTKHAALKFSFDNGDIFFTDTRHFGTFKVVRQPEMLQEKLDKLGWDALQDPKIPTDLFDKMHKKHGHKKIAEFMMEQGPLISGIGNYIRNECLFLSKISPFRLISSLSNQELETIFTNYISIVQSSYASNGATLHSFQDMNGNKGEFSSRFLCYSRETDPNGNKVVRVPDKNNRMIHYVPEIQL